MGFLQWLLGNAVPLQVILVSVFVGSTLLFVSDSAHRRNVLRCP
jgi:hypothetical protein